VTYPEPEVIEYVNDHFVPWNINTADEVDLIQRFDIFSTPSIVFMDPKGRDFYRSIGYLPPTRFIGRLIFGEAWVAFRTRHYEHAGDLFEIVGREHPDCSIAPEAIFFRGAARDKITGDHSNRAISAAELKERFPKSNWTFSASVWIED